MSADDTRPAQSMPIRGYPTWIGIPKKEYERHAALVAAAREVAEDYHELAIVYDDLSGPEHPAVTYDLCTDPKCAALRAALDGEPEPEYDYVADDLAFDAAREDRYR